MRKIHLLSLLFLLLNFNLKYAHVQDPSSVVAKGAKPVLVSSDFIFTEGPAVDADGNIFFTDQPNDKIMKWSTDGTLSVFMEGAGRSNGLFFDNEGHLISCADRNNQLWQIDKNKNVTILVKDFEGKKLNGPNDVWVDPKGGMYFTDPFYKRDYWTRTEKEIEQENVYYLSPDKKKLSIVAADLLQPNGLIGTPDGKKLYIADIKGRKTYAYSINDDGTLTNKTLFTDMGSDGMTIDRKGNVYLTGRGVTVFNSKGEKLENIPIDAPWTANVCFGGKDRKTLFITASKSVYTLKMKVKGAY
ncbi:SMP-30/gluconolactonase/LRE family protein [Chryseolinea sp. H1M3-3]|uniref:SMP-30/gluconolactonase/LRE family protein n=1 Tax=Chryseolinea sp. H1M3-3 TaxID=3034144 RepID=UPI0023EC588E|nr:SMP-30/gluconolactonase/LRE family protein [Chryseolinea sp. H1M3-3]